MPRRAAGVDGVSSHKDSNVADESYDNGKVSSAGAAFFVAVLFFCVFMPLCVFFLYSSTAPNAKSLLRGGTLELPVGAQQLSKTVYLAQDAQKGTHGLVTTAAPNQWRHPLQQDPGLPAGPEHPAGPGPAGATSMVRCNTTAGPISIQVHEAWSPHGAKRFVDMVESGFFSTKVALFRAVRSFLCQTGISGDPSIHKVWSEKGTIEDDPQWLGLSLPNRMKRGYVSFAGGGKDSRGTEFFFAFRDIPLGDSPWEVPFGTLVGDESFQTMDHWYTGYGDLQPFGGKAPDQTKMYSSGLSYLQRDFPEIDYITACTVADNQPGMTAIQGYKTTYATLQQGSGETVKKGSRVKVHATGIVQQTGKKFWSTKDPGKKPFTYTAGVGQVIIGWDQGLLGARMGERRKIIIPSDEGYGAGGFAAWGIPPGAALEFTLEVLHLEDPKTG
eukprot:TRINITY_DN26373_c0_g1_i1.p1 TRINITY_DN26373_c0_g1~~TRINITY_DN26373_c0_g1_i1.p1  ORF type:complete len:442 (-),score=59.75 TRINITY_DN26373_c0_g1_i1:178-1503(-)